MKLTREQLIDIIRRWPSDVFLLHAEWDLVRMVDLPIDQWELPGRTMWSEHNLKMTFGHWPEEGKPNE